MLMTCGTVARYLACNFGCEECRSSTSRDLYMVNLNVSTSPLTHALLRVLGVLLVAVLKAAMPV